MRTIEEVVDEIEDIEIDDINASRAAAVAERLDEILEIYKAEQSWIPVSDRLPSDCGCDWVLAQIQEDNGYLWIPKVMEYRKNIDDWRNDDLGWLKDHNGAFKVVAWMPLPQPYKVESEE